MKLREAWRESKPEKVTISAKQYYLNIWYALYTICFFITVAIAILFGPWWALFPAVFVGYCIGRHQIVIQRAAQLEIANREHDAIKTQDSYN